MAVENASLNRAAPPDRPTVAFDEVEAPPPSRTLAGLVASMTAAIQQVHATRVLRVCYTPRSLPLQVVRVLVPGLEFFTMTSGRVGRRLGDHVSRLC